MYYLELVKCLYHYDLTGDKKYRKLRIQGMSHTIYNESAKEKNVVLTFQIKLYVDNVNY